MKYLIFVMLWGIAVLYAAAGNSPEFIPVEQFFSNRKPLEATISPSGRYLVGQTIHEGVNRNYLVTFSMDLETRKVIILDSGMRTIVYSYRWVGDDRLLISFFLGKGLMFTDADGSNQLQVTGKDNVLIHADLLDLLPDDPDHVLMQNVFHGKFLWDRITKFVNDGKPVTGVYKVNIHTGEHEQIVVDEVNAITYITDRQGEVRIAIGNPEVEFDDHGLVKTVHPIHDRDEVAPLLYKAAFLREDEQWRLLDVPVVNDPLGREFAFQSPFFESDDTVVYLSNVDRERKVLLRLRLKSGEEELAFEHPEVDLDEIVASPLTGAPIGVRYTHDKSYVHYFQKGFRHLLEQVQELYPDRSAEFTSWSKDLKRFIVRTSAGHVPGEYFLLDLNRGDLEEVHTDYLKLKGQKLTPVKQISFSARDGARIFGYLTRPDHLEERAGPMILLVHGGPFLRDTPEFDPMVQFFADRGYAVLQVNYRGSTGYGRAFMLEGKQQQGLRMQDDLEDAVRWAIEQEIAEPGRIAIAGGSYGGYAAALGLVESPELFAAGIVINGVLDPVRQIETLARQGFRWQSRFHREWWGDLENEEDLARLKRLSPLRRVQEIEAPVFVYYGHRDDRVYPDQSMDYLRLLRRNRVPHDKYSYDFGGHGLADEDSRIELFRRIERFLRKYMPSDLME